MKLPALVAIVAATALLASCGDRTAGQPDPGSPVESAVPPKRFSALRGALAPDPIPAPVPVPVDQGL